MVGSVRVILKQASGIYQVLQYTNVLVTPKTLAGEELMGKLPTDGSTVISRGWSDTRDLGGRHQEVNRDSCKGPRLTSEYKLSNAPDEQSPVEIQYEL